MRERLVTGIRKLVNHPVESRYADTAADKAAQLTLTSLWREQVLRCLRRSRRWRMRI
ncbi:MAG: hypothetical protein IPM08_15205 [Actinomycetales bacterium]|nr:hypothetical protein [Actinomycetales bacterium]